MNITDIDPSLLHSIISGDVRAIDSYLANMLEREGKRLGGTPYFTIENIEGKIVNTLKIKNQDGLQVIDTMQVAQNIDTFFSVLSQLSSSFDIGQDAQKVLANPKQFFNDLAASYEVASVSMVFSALESNGQKYIAATVYGWNTENQADVRQLYSNLLYRLIKGEI